MEKERKISMNDTIKFIYKQVIAVRIDLKMGKGKIAVQVAHGAISAAELVRTSDYDVWKAWLDEGQKKVVVKVSSREELLDISNIGIEHKLPCSLVRDFGLTQIDSGTYTVVALGPAKEELVDKITNHLKLL